MRKAVALATVLGLFVVTSSFADPDDADIEAQGSIIVPEPTPTIDFSALSKVVAATLQSDFVSALNTGTALAFTEKDVAAAAEEAKRAFKNVKTEAGDPKTAYDIVIQIGHYDRKDGQDGRSGSLCQ
jgi:hypothetical protein